MQVNRFGTVDDLLRFQLLDHSQNFVRNGRQLRRFAVHPAEGAFHTRGGHHLFYFETSDYIQGQTAIVALQAKHRQISRVHADDTFRDEGVETTVVSTRRLLHAVDDPGEFLEALVSVLQEGRRHRGFHADVRPEHKHILHRNALHYLVFHSVSKVRRDQQRSDGDQSRPDRSEQLPVLIADRRKIRRER